MIGKHRDINIVDLRTRYVFLESFEILDWFLFYGDEKAAK